MSHKLLFVSVGAAVALGAVATATMAAPASGLSGVRSADRSKLLYAVHDDDDHRDRSWSHRFRWDDDDRGHGRWWWWHHRHHRDRDHDERWSGRDHDDRDGHRYR
jgi:hypothetical protein